MQQQSFVIRGDPMINILFVVPYPDLEERVKLLGEKYRFREKVNFRAIVVKPENVNRISPGEDCDVLIARGYTATKLKKFFPRLPVVRIPITGYDVMRAVYECKQTYHPKRIGYVGPQEIPVDAENLSKALGCHIRVYYSNTVREVSKAIAQAQLDKCDAVVGGNMMRFCAQHFHLPAVIIKTGDEAILQAIREAVHTVEILRTKRERSGVFHTIIQSIREGILYVNASNQIIVANPAARKLFPDLPDPLNGCELEKMIPFMEEFCNQVRLKKREILNHIYTWEGITISIDYVPVRANRQIVGVLINFQNVFEIQQTETQIRKQLKVEKKKEKIQDIRDVSAEAEREIILKILQDKKYNRNETARQLGIDRTTLWRKMNRYQIEIPQKRKDVVNLKHKK